MLNGRGDVGSRCFGVGADAASVQLAGDVVQAGALLGTSADELEQTLIPHRSRGREIIRSGRSRAADVDVSRDEDHRVQKPIRAVKVDS